MSGTRHHCAGVLVEASSGETLGLHSNVYKLRDDEGGVHVLFCAHGRGAEAADRADLQNQGMHLGQRYHASGTQFRQGETMGFYFGRVELAPDQRQPHVPNVGHLRADVEVRA